jgi:hypothetical protein
MGSKEGCPQKQTPGTGTSRPKEKGGPTAAAREEADSNRLLFFAGRLGVELWQAAALKLCWRSAERWRLTPPASVTPNAGD